MSKYHLRKTWDYSPKDLAELPDNTIVVLCNDVRHDYYTHDQIWHLVRVQSGRAWPTTLCGTHHAAWSHQYYRNVGAATLCERCERIAHQRGYSISV